MDTVYICPVTKQKLTKNPGFSGLTTSDGIRYCFIDDGGLIPNFLPKDAYNASQTENLRIYNNSDSVERYRNELNWLYDTFGVSEASFRTDLLEKLELKEGQRILITGCGLGSDIPHAMKAVGQTGAVYAQDLAPEMVLYSSEFIKATCDNPSNVRFSVSDAQALPFSDGFFDAVFHFGGINLFDDVCQSIKEMARVTAIGGRVVFGDESVAPWLRDTTYGKAAIFNNSLWEGPTPIQLLPENAIDVEMSWVFGNCFYLISFVNSAEGPYMNMDVPHIGARGGSMRTRYFGRLEGVTESSKSFVKEEARRRGMSIHDWLEELISKERGRP